MDLCKYSTQNKCTSCNYVSYKQCEKFRRAHVRMLIEEILPFKSTEIRNVTGHVVWSRDINKIKMSCALSAVAHNSKVRKLTLNQVMSLTLESQEVSDKIIFIEISQKIQGDQEKVLNVLRSFIDRVVMTGSYVSIYVGVPLSITATLPEYSQL